MIVAEEYVQGCGLDVVPESLRHRLVEQPRTRTRRRDTLRRKLTRDITINQMIEVWLAVGLLLEDQRRDLAKVPLRLANCVDDHRCWITGHRLKGADRKETRSNARLHEPRGLAQHGRHGKLRHVHSVP